MGFLLHILTPKGVYFEKEIDSLNIKLTSGERTILKGHSPLIGALAISCAHISLNNETKYYAINGGVISVKKNGEVFILTNTIEYSKDIDVERALKAKERAEKRLAEKENIDIKRAQLALYRSLARIDASSKN